MKLISSDWARVVLTLALFLVMAGQATAAPPDPIENYITIAPRPQVTCIDSNLYYILESPPPYTLYIRISERRTGMVRIPI